MEDSNPQEIIAYLHVGFLDRCASHYTNLPCMPCRDCAGAFILDKRAASYGLQLPVRKEAIMKMQVVDHLGLEPRTARL